MGLDASSQHKFDFNYLYHFAQNQTLSYDGCVEAVGTGIAWYSRQDVYDRVLLWRVPLLALWATTTLPALRWHTQIFTLVHLIADPIDTIWSLLYKLDLAKRTTRWTEENDRTWSSFTFLSEGAHVKEDTVAGGSLPPKVIEAEKRTARINAELQRKDSPLRRYFHDVPALIITAYDEWGCGDQAWKAMNYGFNIKRWIGVERTQLRKRCAASAFLIASDRVSRFLPSAAASMVFVVQLSASFWKTLDTLGDTYDESNPVSAGLNRAPHNIAFGALFFWLPFVVLLTALVGGSQTSHLVPRVLEDFRKDFEKAHPPPEAPGAGPASPPLGRSEAANFPDISSQMYERWSCGGLPVWQAEKFRDFARSTEDRPNHRPFAWSGMGLSIAVVAVPTGCAMAISWLTPTKGFGCRAMTQLSFFIMWVISAGVDSALSAWARPHSSKTENPASMSPRYYKIYWITFAKDLAFMLGTIAMLTLTALGIFNKCECWCKWPKSSGYLSFLQDDSVYRIIKLRLEWTFPWIIVGALFSQILIFSIIYVVFRKGHRVLKQRDIDSVLDSSEPHSNNSQGSSSENKPVGRVNTMEIIAGDGRA